MNIESDNGLDQYKLKNMQVLVEVTSDLHLFQTNEAITCTYNCNNDVTKFVAETLVSLL